MQPQKVNYPSKKIKVGQKNWTFTVVPSNHPRLGKGNWGRCQWKDVTVYASNRLGQKNFKLTMTHELLHTMFDSIGFHDQLVRKLKASVNEKMVDGLARTLLPFIRPETFKIPHHHLIQTKQKKQKTRS